MCIIILIQNVQAGKRSEPSLWPVTIQAQCTLWGYHWSARCTVRLPLKCQTGFFKTLRENDCYCRNYKGWLSCRSSMHCLLRCDCRRCSLVLITCLQCALTCLSVSCWWLTSQYIRQSWTKRNPVPQLQAVPLRWSTSDIVVIQKK